MATNSKVNLLDLAAAAVACTVSASRAIRHIEKSQNARLKQDGSFVTDADFTAQGVIVKAIRSVSAHVRILGEESPEEMAQHIQPDNIGATDDEDLYRRTRNEIRHLYHHPQSTEKKEPSERLPLAQGAAVESALLSVPDQHPEDCLVDPNRVSVIVDPLDGTKSYTRGDTEVVSILIAIVLDNTPIFGVVGKPFGYPGLSSILDTGCATLYGGSLLQAVYVAGGCRLVPPAIVGQPRCVISGSRSKGVVHDFCVHLGQVGLVHPEPMEISGAGEKSLRLILRNSNEALWFFPKPGTSRWDVAAPDALLRVLNGKLTDKFGNELDYSVVRENAENANGVVACIDADLHARCIELFREGDWLDRK